MPGPDPSPERLEGAVERVVFFNEETGYAVLRVNVKGRREPVTVVGNTPAVYAGENLRAEGVWHRSADYGTQFKAAVLQTDTPASPAGIERFLGSGLIEGIGPELSRRLVKKFGGEVLNIIDRESARLEEVGGIGRKRRLQIKSSWNAQKTVRDIMVFLHSHGVGGARARRIYKTYGEEAVAVVRENPYLLARDIRGIGFKSADKIAASLGLSGDHPARLRAGLRHLLFEAASSGDCALPRPQLLELGGVLLGVDALPLEAALEGLAQSGEIIPETHGDAPLIFPRHLHEAECAVAGILSRLVTAPTSLPAIDADRAISWAETRTGTVLSPGQADAVRLALRARVAVITGGPGVGKTTVLRTLLLILGAKGVGPVLCAPTGRAAKRLSESTGLPASTLHRKLEVRGDSGGFSRHAGNRLEGDFFVIDEVSMVDVTLMRHFLLALPDAAHLVLVGDADQLPSVGPGSVLESILASGRIPSVRLVEIFRQAARSRIITAAHDIREGRVPALPARPEPDCDCYFIAEPDSEKLPELVRCLVRERITTRFGFSPDEIQVLTPMNRNSTGAIHLNRVLQDSLNPPRPECPGVDRFGVEFRPGDRVMQTLNNYHREVFNGDMGRILEVTADPTEVIVRFDDGRSSAYPPSEIDELRHAFAVTIHKSQGSEFPVVVVPLSMQHFVLLQRNLVYTALTRARKLAILVGDPKAFSLAVGNRRHRARWTALTERLARTAQ